jgi:hypothetical protein
MSSCPLFKHFGSHPTHDCYGRLVQGVSSIQNLPRWTQQAQRSVWTLGDGADIFGELDSHILTEKPHAIAELHGGLSVLGSVCTSVTKSLLVQIANMTLAVDCFYITN